MNKLREKRKERGLTIIQLSLGSGVSVGYIGQIEQGINPSIYVKTKLSNFLGLEIKDIFPNI